MGFLQVGFHGRGKDNSVLGLEKPEGQGVGVQDPTEGGGFGENILKQKGVLTALEVFKREAEQAGVGGGAGDQQGGGFRQPKHVDQAAEQEAKGGQGFASDGVTLLNASGGGGAGEDLDGVAGLGQVEGEVGEQLGGGGVAGVEVLADQGEEGNGVI